MDTAKWQTLYVCFIAGGLTVPIFDLVIGSIGSALGGGGADADTDFDVDADTDFDVDADTSFDLDTNLVVGLGHSVRPERRIIVNLMTLSFTAVVFGAFGRLLIHMLAPLPTLLLSIVAGLTGGYLIGRFIILPLKRNRPLAGGIRDVKGMDGIVKLELRSDFVGTIKILCAAGSQVSYSAKPMDGIDRILVGTHVRVMNVDLQKQICIVIPLE